ncbi:MAG TPA: hypothetical protein VML53_05345 [Thermoplasmata archaeon]|nr:hypothetical protein [Thermoplasmata archaeon]
MAGLPYRRPSTLGRKAHRHRTLLAVGLVCAAVVVVALGATTGFFGLLKPAGAPSGYTGPPLNPDHQLIAHILGSLTGPNASQFSGFTGDLCGIRCPLSPMLYTTPTPAEIGVYFFFNVTDVTGVAASIAAPTIRTSGADPTLFVIITYCCFSSTHASYTEEVASPFPFTSTTPVGFAGYAYTTVPIPATAGDSYTLWVNSTAS